MRIQMSFIGYSAFFMQISILVASGAPFTSGNFVILRSNGSTSAAQLLMLVEYSQTGTQIQSIPVSFTTCTLGGTTTTEGKLELNAAGSRVAWGCYDCPPGTPSVSAVRPSGKNVVARLSNFSTALNIPMRSLLHLHVNAPLCL